MAFQQISTKLDESATVSVEIHTQNYTATTLVDFHKSFPYNAANMTIPSQTLPQQPVIYRNDNRISGKQNP
jgi:hypothetical protein